jgi:hypothetical protein
MRLLFSDSWNSFWHIIFGMIAAKYNIVLILFLGYEIFKHHFISQSYASIIEFFIGFIIIKIIYLYLLKDPLEEIPDDSLTMVSYLAEAYPTEQSF